MTADQYNLYAVTERNSFYSEYNVKFIGADSKEEALELYISEFGDRFTKGNDFLSYEINRIPYCRTNYKGCFKSIEV